MTDSRTGTNESEHLVMQENKDVHKKNGNVWKMQSSQLNKLQWAKLEPFEQENKHQIIIWNIKQIFMSLYWYK